LQTLYKMKNNIVIRFENVSKRFKRGRKLLLKEVLVNVFRPDPTEWFWALRDTGFTIKRGESVGIIGPNGSGKSTVLKLISGFMIPDKGKVEVNGRVSPLIELGAGFHPELTGRENIYLNGVILGLSRKEVKERFDSIVSFAEIEDFIDTPVKHYSSGMYMRLGFSVAVHVDPDILLVDELLAVGDANFQAKCMQKMKEFKKRGVAIVLVSHNLDIVESFCDRAFYIDKGKLLSSGDPRKVIDDYTQMKEFRWGDRLIEIKDLLVNSGQGKVIPAGKEFKVIFDLEFHEDVKDPVFGIVVRNKSNEEVFAANTIWNRIKTGKFQKGESRRVIFSIDVSIPAGEYSISPAVAYSDLSRTYDWRNNMVFFKIVGKSSPKKGDISIKIK